MEFTHTRTTLRKTVSSLAGMPSIPAGAKLLTFDEGQGCFVPAPRKVSTLRTLHRLHLGGVSVRLRGRDLTLVGNLA